jgi:hypothetical protein
MRRLCEIHAKDALRAIHLLGSFSKAGRVGNLLLRRRHRLYESPRPAQAILETVGDSGCRARFGHGLLGVGPGLLHEVPGLASLPVPVPGPAAEAELFPASLVH